MKKIFVLFVLILVAFCNAAKYDKIKKFKTCVNNNGGGFFWVNTSSGEIWWGDPGNVGWKYFGKPKNTIIGVPGTYIPYENKSGGGLFILNTITGEGWWTAGQKLWRKMGEPEAIFTKDVKKQSLPNPKLKGSKLSKIPIKPGKGCGDFKVGSSKKHLIKFLGKPDEMSEENWLCWRNNIGVDAMFIKNKAHELRFNPGFSGKLDSGIKINSTENEVIDIYGKPDHITDKGNAKKIEYSSKGLLIWFNDGKVSQIVVFKPY